MNRRSLRIRAVVLLSNIPPLFILGLRRAWEHYGAICHSPSSLIAACMASGARSSSPGQTTAPISTLDDVQCPAVDT